MSAPEPASAPSSEGRSYGGESPDDRTSRRRRQLLDAGLEVFGTVGYRGATVRGVCRSAQVTDRYFYESFPGLEDLLLGVYEECMARLVGAVVGALEPVPADADLETVSRVGLEAFFAVAQERQLARVVWLEVLGVSPRIDAAYLHSLRVFAELMTARVRMAVGITPAMHPDEEAIFAMGAVGGMNQMAMTWLLEGYSTPTDRVVSAGLRYLVAVGRAFGG